MIEIKLFFFIIGSFFMLEQPNLCSQKVIVQIDPIQKQVRIEQQDLINLGPGETIEESLDYQKIHAGKVKWSEDTDAFSDKQVSWEGSGKDKKAIITFRYQDKEDLSSMGIFGEGNNYSMISMDGIQPLSGKSKLEDNYLVFDGSSPFSFQMEFPMDQVLGENDGRMQVRPEFKGLPLLGLRSGAIRGQTFQLGSMNAGQLETLDDGISFVLEEEGNQVIFEEAIPGTIEFMDNNILRVKMDKTSSKTSPFNDTLKEFRYEYDAGHRRLQLYPVDQTDTKKNSSEKPIYFLGIS